LSLSYSTGDRPASDYLKGIQIYFTVNNIFNRAPPFQYGGTTNAYAYYGGGVGGANIPPDYNPFGRFWRLGVTKQW
jgi:outer membrane receptor protein involved in Fe transport